MILADLGFVIAVGLFFVFVYIVLTRRNSKSMAEFITITKPTTVWVVICENRNDHSKMIDAIYTRQQDSDNHSSMQATLYTSQQLPVQSRSLQCAGVSSLDDIRHITGMTPADFINNGPTGEDKVLMARTRIMPFIM
jgi:hypothetical protein